jgi:hypothetical protein
MRGKANRELTEQPKILYHLLQSFHPLLVVNKVSEIVGLSECKCIPVSSLMVSTQRRKLGANQTTKSDPTVRTCELLFRRDNA